MRILYIYIYRTLVGGLKRMKVGIIKCLRVTQKITKKETIK
jgi:hypothetical protein